MSGRLELWLFVLQRLSAMVLAPLVLIHLVTMISAVQGGLSAPGAGPTTLEVSVPLAGFPGPSEVWACGMNAHGELGRGLKEEVPPDRGFVQATELSGLGDEERAGEASPGRESVWCERSARDGTLECGGGVQS